MNQVSSLENNNGVTSSSDAMCVNELRLSEVNNGERWRFRQSEEQNGERLQIRTDERLFTIRLQILIDQRIGNSTTKRNAT